LSRKPSRSVVSAGEKRTAEDGRGGGFGKIFDREGSKENSKSENGAGGCKGEVVIVVDCKEWQELILYTGSGYYKDPV
jgi:hypothetical protein